MVVGIDITYYIKQLSASREKCSYSAAYFEALSQYLQNKYQFQPYKLPELVIYSSGADTLPFMVNRLPEMLKSKVQTIALLGMGKNANFEFHVADWLYSSGGKNKVIPKVQKLKGMHVMYIW